jgi:hypothetical protein
MSSPIYEPLPTPNSFRLLELAILPREIPRSDNLASFACILHTFELDNAPSYEALSYTWGDAVRDNIVCTEEEEALGDSNESVSIVLSKLSPKGRQMWFGETSESSSSPAPDNDAELSIGVVHSITINLYHALNQLFQSGHGYKMIWIDALCINQADTDEKGTQVAMMGEIYSRASGVIVWLGEDETGMENFKWTSSKFLDALSGYVIKYGLKDLCQQSPLSSVLLERLNINPPAGDWLACWESYMTFCRRRRWFSRIWIVQEVVLAKHVRVMCGRETCAWEGIEMLGSMIKLLGWQSMLGISPTKAFGRALGDETMRLACIRETLPPRSPSEVCEVTSASAMLKSVSLTSGASSTASTKETHSWYDYLQMLIWNTRPYSATDPRDKIFALLGIAAKALPAEMAMPVLPDYCSEISTVYASMSSMLLRELPRLSHLSFVEDKATRRQHSLPSWVPDYSVTLTATPLSLLRTAESCFNASPIKDNPSSWHVVEGSNLNVEGVVLDRISELCLPLWDVIMTSNIESYLQACEGLVDQYPITNEDPGEVLCRTLIADTMNGAAPAMETIIPSFKIWVCSQLGRCLTPEIMSTSPTGVKIYSTKLDENAMSLKLETLRKLHDRCKGMTSLPTVHEVMSTIRQIHRFKLQNFVSQYAVLDPNDPFPTLVQQMNRISAGSEKMHVALMATMPFRRVYRTVNGYLGLGPASMAVGDEVWLLRGAMVPFILRGSEEGKCELVGDTYLHGAMNGEMAEGKNDQMRVVSIV